MSDEERTQAPSKKRRQEARERGQAAHSPELTAASGLLAALLLLSLFSAHLSNAFGSLTTRCLGGSPWELGTPGALAALVRETALSLALPLSGILLGTMLAMVLVHQLQVGGLWAPSRLAPDISRLVSGHQAASRQAFQGAWTLLKAATIAALTTWLLARRMSSLNLLALQDVAALAGSSSHLLLQWLEPLAVALLVLGLADFLLRLRHFENQLRLTPDQQKQELRETDGDPALRARQRSAAASWRSDPADLLPGASLVVTAGSSLAILLAGKRPPGPITVRQVARGSAARALKSAAARAGLAVADSPALALHLARGQREALPPHHLATLQHLWPRE